MKYKILEHTADLKIKVFGKTKEELFLNAVLAMQDCLKPRIKDPRAKPQIKSIKTKSGSLETLLVDFLSEVLYSIQVNKEIYNRIVFQKISNKELEAELKGNTVERFEEDIKGVTYHNLEISQREDGSWQAIILFDI